VLLRNWTGSLLKRDNDVRVSETEQLLYIKNYMIAVPPALARFVARVHAVPAQFVQKQQTWLAQQMEDIRTLRPSGTHLQLPLADPGGSRHGKHAWQTGRISERSGAQRRKSSPVTRSFHSTCSFRCTWLLISRQLTLRLQDKVYADLCELEGDRVRCRSRDGPRFHSHHSG
jgi:hypothetical protein